jgi:2-methylisocitrate lyase-like PEP mutase family enzyme
MKHPMNEQTKKARDFLALHHAEDLLILPNAWDAASAKLFETENFNAIATTSAGIAAVLGYADGQEMSLEENLGLSRIIVRSTSLPVSVDIEAGYATSAEDLARVAGLVLDTGAVGLNLEDSTGNPAMPLYDTHRQQEKIRAMREMSSQKGIHLVINARTDTCLINNDVNVGIRQAIERGNAYREAGADCIFIPDMDNLDEKVMSVFVNEIDAPINIIAGENTPPISVLQEIGVSRVSLGPRPMRATLSLLRDMAREIKKEGSFKLMTDSTINYSDVNQWFTRKN